MKHKTICLLFGIVFLMSFALAAPGIPHQFYGSVTVNGELVSENNIIVAFAEGDNYTTITTNGFYGNAPNIFYVEDPNGDRAGDEIIFYLGGKEIGRETFVSNGLTRLDIDTTTDCSDGYCIGDETCSSCSSDCGVCTDPPVITIGSPTDTVYDTDKIDLIVTSDQNIIMWMYSLNGADPITFTPDIIMTAFFNETTGIGENTLTVIGINDQFQSGTSTVDFRVELIAAFCGDLSCDAANGESCSSCPTDCGACSGGGGSSGGGSSGGGSSGGGSSGGGSSGGSSSGASSDDDVLDSSEENDNFVDLIGDGAEEEGTVEKGFFSMITGAVVGAVGTTIGMVSAAFILLVVLGLVAVKIIRKKKI